MSANLVFDRPADTVMVARFIRPDARDALYDDGTEYDDIGRSTLYGEFHAGAVAPLPDGGTVVLNFGLVSMFSSAFYRFLLRAKQDLKAKHGKLVLCCLTSHSQEAFMLMGGPKTFEVFPTEELAVKRSKE